MTKALHDMEYVQFADGIYQINQTTGELTLVPPTKVDYPVELTASLTDRDGSEVFDSLVLSGMAKGSELYKGQPVAGYRRGRWQADLHRVGQAVEQQCTGSEPERSDSAGTGDKAGLVNLKVDVIAKEVGTDLTSTATDDDSIRLSYFNATEGEPGTRTGPMAASTISWWGSGWQRDAAGPELQPRLHGSTPRAVSVRRR